MIFASESTSAGNLKRSVCRHVSIIRPPLYPHPCPIMPASTSPVHEHCKRYAAWLVKAYRDLSKRIQAEVGAVIERFYAREMREGQGYHWLIL